MNILRTLLRKINFWGKNFKTKILSNSKSDYQNFQETRSHNDKNSKLLNTMKIKIRSIITHELLIWLGSLGEVFFALFILSYAVYPNVWSISLIVLGVLGK